MYVCMFACMADVCIRRTVMVVVCACACMNECMHAYAYPCMHVCMYAHHTSRRWLVDYETAMLQCNVILTAYAEFRHAEGAIKTILSVILAVGNYLNGGSTRGQAYGYVDVCVCVVLEPCMCLYVHVCAYPDREPA